MTVAAPRRDDRRRLLHTAFWETREAIELDWPDDWSVTVRWPKTPPPLTTPQIADALREPVKLASIAELCHDAKKPLIIIDDLSRPTPVDLILEPLLEQLGDVGIQRDQVTILLATGTHPFPNDEMVTRKVGQAAADACRIVVHQDSADCRAIGRTSFGTPIEVDQEVLDADWIIGIGGVYPNNTAGFGGGSKLALGVLSRRSITHLHEKHRPAGWGGDNRDHRFRKDLDEIAERIGLVAMISVHVDAEARPVRVVFGDHRAYYPEEARWAAGIYTVEPPGDADVVVANAYPSDATLTTAKHKAFAPLNAARPGATRVLLASCHAGTGNHGLYPLVSTSTSRERLRRKMSVMSPSQFAVAAMGSVRRRLARKAPRSAWPVIVYRPGSGTRPDLPSLSSLPIAPSWTSVLDRIREQQSAASNIQVVVYPCAPLLALRTVSKDSP